LGFLGIGVEEADSSFSVFLEIRFLNLSISSWLAARSLDTFPPGADPPLAEIFSFKESSEIAAFGGTPPVAVAAFLLK